MPNLTQLIPTTGLQAWHRFETGVSGPNLVGDYSGNARHLVNAAGNDPVLNFNVLNGEPGWLFNGTSTAPLKYTGSVTVKHGFILAAHTDATFNLNRGLLTGVTSGDILISNSSATDFFDISGTTPDFAYAKSDVLYAQANQEAPMIVPELLEFSSFTGLSPDGIQVGLQRAIAGRIWKGYFFEELLYNQLLTTDQKNAIKLYMNLKYGLWRSTALPMHFPTPGMTGIPYRHFYAMPDKWDDTVISHQYEDGGRSFNEISDVAIKEWTVEFDCVAQTHALAQDKYEIFDSFWDAVRTSRPFNFQDKYGTTHTNVRVKDYSRSHRAHKSWVNEAIFRLCKYP